MESAEFRVKHRVRLHKSSRKILIVESRDLCAYLLVDTVEDQASTATWVADCSDGDCSLREAIEAANADPALDVIGFDVPAGGGVATIVLSTL